MIRFIDKREAPDVTPSELVGRFVGKEGVMHARGYSRPMKVVSVSGSRLHGVAGELTGSVREGDLRLAPVETWTEDCYLGLKTIAYVCDTVEECEALLLASRRSLATWTEGTAALKSEIDRDYDRIVAEFAANSVPAP